MKPILLLFFQFIIVQTINCQTNLFPSEDATWRYMYCDIASNLSWESTQGFLGDSLHNNISYSKISSSSDNDSGLLRVENEKVFFIPKDSIEEILLYDFSLEVGDTFHLADNWFLFSPDFLVVSSIDSVLITIGNYRKRINFNIGNYWIEGIGAYSGSITHPRYYESLSGEKNLICLKQNSEIIYEKQSVCYITNNPKYGCDGLIINTIEVEDISIKIFPNLLNDETEIQIESNSQIKEVKVFDLKLRSIKNRLENNIISFDDNLVPGMYILHIICDKGLLSKKIIKL